MYAYIRVVGHSRVNFNKITLRVNFFENLFRVDCLYNVWLRKQNDTEHCIRCLEVLSYFRDIRLTPIGKSKFSTRLNDIFQKQ